ncbi:MAG: MFS transporter, partial [Thermoleophilia bacterium]|nr:MFS transporter [Thermoleophilia bacterium]
FLLDAGLTATEAFVANAFYTAGMVIFEIPTGVVADTWGRRASFLLGAATLLVSTFFYLALWQIAAPLWLWAIASVFIGLGFTFFSGAVEAWLVDALDFTRYEGTLDSVFARGQVAAGIAMLSGSVAGGFVAQVTSLGVPYILRVVMLGLTLVVAFLYMRDLGFTPHSARHPIREMKTITSASLENGLRNPPVRWIMLASPFTAGVGIYAFYAMQPYLLELYGNPNAYTVAGLAAAIVAGAQIVGGLLVDRIRRLFGNRTTLLITTTSISGLALLAIGLTSSFWIAIGGLVVWAMLFAVSMPVRQAYINGLIPSQQRATVLSFDALLGSSGAVGTQPVLGRVADVYGYSTSYVVSAAIQVCAVPFVFLARREKAGSDPMHADPGSTAEAAPSS